MKRNPGADIIRIIAFFFVVSVHFFLNNGFYEQTVDGARMLVMTLMRAVFIICVPLFLTLSGYLLRKKQLSKKYYKRISKIIITYVLASLFCMLYSSLVLKESISLAGAVMKLLNFTGAPYSWYIEMYLGLFLLIPFLNLAYNNIPSRKWKLALVITFIVLTSLPSVINVYDLGNIGFWTLPSAYSTKFEIIPDFWVSLYPITYYFIGCYLSEYGLKISKTLNIILLALCVSISGLYSYWRSYKAIFIWGEWCGYQSIFNVIITTLVFTLFVNIDYSKMPQKVCLFLQKLSALSLGGYLVSWVFDSIFYPILLNKISLVTDRLEYYFIIVPVIFISSLIISYLLGKIQFLLEKAFSLCLGLIKSHFTPK